MNFQINYYTLSSLSIVLSCLFLILVLYSRNPRSLVSRSFIVFAITVLGWSSFYFLWQISFDYQLALTFTKLLMFFSSFIPSSFLFAVLAYTGQMKQKFFHLIAAYLISLFLSLLSLSDQIVASLGQNKYHSLWPLAGPMCDVFFTIWFSILVYSHLLLYRAYLSEDDRRKRTQIIVLIIGFGLSFLGGVTNFFLWYNIPVPPMGNFIGPIFFVFIAYAVMKLGFLNLDSTKAHLSTFWNDLLFNPFKGLSIITDNETAYALRNFRIYPELEKSGLLKLSLVRKKSKGMHVATVDALREVLKEVIQYFKPEEQQDRRIKNNLKYHILKMIAFDEAEEGQILWELGFEDYPVRLMTIERRDRPPKFKDFSPADYHYTSRNAYLALKREAIHDVTWRISYLEKLSKR